MIQATLDTNTLASGAVATGGTIGTVIDTWLIARAFRVALSETILIELNRTLQKRDFTKRLSLEDLTDYQTAVRTTATIVRITTPVPTVARSRVDNLVLATAASAGVQYLVSGDRELQQLGRFYTVEILSPRRFVDLFEEQGVARR